MTPASKACGLGVWRLRHATLTQPEAADRAGIPLAHADRIESEPRRATLGAVASYVQACGGKFECIVEIGRVRLLLVLLALLGACTECEPIPPAAIDLMDSDLGALGQPFEGTESATCERVFSPVPELAVAVAAAAARWSSATGCDIHVSAGGILVRTAPVLTDATGEHLLGGTHYGPLENVIDADIGGETRQRTVDHEMGHALIGGPGHAADGLMMSGAPAGSKITVATLTLVCASLDCGAFNPEH